MERFNWGNEKGACFVKVPGHCEIINNNPLRRQPDLIKETMTQLRDMKHIIDKSGEPNKRDIKLFFQIGSNYQKNKIRSEAKLICRLVTIFYDLALWRVCWNIKLKLAQNVQ